jgi:hypothetical protein
MYEIKIAAASVSELRGRVLALAAQLTSEANAARAPVAVAPEPVVVAPEPVVVVPEPVAEEPVAAETLTYEQVRTAILQVSVGVGREAVGTILRHFGATQNAQEIDPSRYAEVLAMAKKTLEG